MSGIRRSTVLVSAAAIVGALLVAPSSAAAASVAPAAVAAPSSAQASTVTVAPPALSAVPSTAGIPARATAETTALAATTDGTCSRALPVGTAVRIGGPSRLVFTGAAACSLGTWRMTVTGGSGVIGGMTLPSTAFGGRISRSRNAASGQVVVKLAAHPLIVPAWTQRASVVVKAVTTGWASTVGLRASSGTGAALSLAGPLNTDSSYGLAGRGSVAFAGTTVPFAGWYRSPGYPYTTATGALRRTTAATWAMSGRGSDGLLPGVRIAAPSLAMTQKKPGVTGTATLRTVAAPYLVARGSLAVVSASSWSLSVRSATSPMAWAPPSTRGLTVRTASTSGSIGVRAGLPFWALSSPMTLVDPQVTVQGTFGWEGATRYRLRATSGTGRILGAQQDLTFTGGPDTLLVAGHRMTGGISVVTQGELLADLEEHWASAATFVLSPVVSGSSWVVQHSVRYDMTNADSHLRFSGVIPSNGIYSLVGSGTVRIAASDVPFHGYYRSRGVVVGGAALSEPDWQLSGTPSGAAGGKVSLEGGAGLVGGSFGFDGGHGAPVAVVPSGAASVSKLATLQPATTPTPASVAGQALMQLAADDPFLLPVTYTYTDQNNWTVTAAGSTSGNTFNPYTGLTIPETAFHGSATDVAGKQTWNLTIDAITWTNMAQGVTLAGSFSVSNTCTLPAHCPDATGIFFSGTSTMTFSSGLPTVTTTGAFLADKSWARWDGTSSTVTFNSISVSTPTLTIWKGARDDEDANLVMPDLSQYNGNGLGIEYCGNYHVTIPDVTTANTLGCVEWSDAGVVMAQTALGGNVTQGAYNGVTLHGTALTGYAWSDLDEAQDLSLNGEKLSLEKGKNYITANLGIPGNVMHDVGAGTSNDTTIPAQGWFDLSGEFEVDGFIPVNMQSSGFTLEDITVHIGKVDHTFTLSMGADCTVAIKGNHFPLTVYVGYEHAGDSTITVRLEAKGTPSSQPNGLMDFTSLLPTGDFEPTNGPLVDGTFDSKPPANAIQDGGFENAKAQGNLVANADFELANPGNLMPNADFEDGSTGNLLANGDSESTDILYNGDFEADAGSTLVGWIGTGNYQYGIGTDTASGASETGTYAAWIKDAATSGSQNNAGLTQKIAWAPPAGTAINVSGWVRGDTSTKTPFNAYLTQTGCTAGSYTTTSAAANVDNTAWQQVTIGATAQAGCTGLTLVLDPTSAGGKVYVDAWQMNVSNAPSATNLPDVWRPHVMARFDSLASTPLASYTSGVSQSSDFGGTLRSSGTNGWMLNSTGYGYVSGDFDMSVKVRFPSGSNTRDIADIGYWMNAASPHNTGYVFRLQTAGGDGGFYEYSANNSITAEPGMTKVADVARDVWYQVRLTASGGSVTAYVTRLDTNAQVFVQTITVSNTYPHSGSFGQFVDGAGSAEGSRWDDLSVYSSNTGAQVRLDPANAHSGVGYTALKGIVPNWASTYSTGEQPAQYTQYTYSAWVRSTGGNVSGQLVLDTDGGTYEKATQAFTATSTWQQVAVTLRVVQSGHTDLRPGFYNMTTTGIELDVDDTVLQQVGWRTWPDDPNSLTELTSSDAHGGAKSLELIDRTGTGSTALLEFPTTPSAANAVTTVSAWVKAPKGSFQGFLRFQESGGASSTPFTATGTWQQVTVTRTGTGGADPYVAVDMSNGNLGVPLLVDDVSVTVTKIDAQSTGDLGAPAQAATWTNQGSSHVVVKNDASTAHGGVVSLQIVPPSNATQSTAYAIPGALSNGATYSASVWLYTGAGGGVSTTVQLSDGVAADTKATTVTATTTWKQVTVTMPVTQTGTTGLTLTITNNNLAANGVRVDDVVLSLQGLAPKDAWTVSDGTGYTSYQVVSNPSNAHAGNDYLEISEHNGTGFGAVGTDSGKGANVGQTVQFAFWAKAPSGTPQVKGVLRTTDSTGTILDSRTVTFTMGPNWSHYFVSLLITKSGSVNVHSEFDIAQKSTAWIDDAEVRPVPTWTAFATTSGTVVDETVLSDSPGAAEGTNYLAVSLPASGGTTTTITADESGKPVQVVAGSSYKLEAYVRSNTSTTFSNALTMSLSYGGSSTETGSQTFDVTGDWTKYSLQFTATKSNTTITPKLTFNTAGNWFVDSISVVPVQVAQSDPWTATDPSVSFGVYDDPTRAHDSSYGLMEAVRNGGNAASGVQHSISQSVSVGQVYNASAWVRSSTGTPVSGTLRFGTVDGNSESVSAPFTAGSDWQLVSTHLTVQYGGHTGLLAQVQLGTAGVVLDIDDVVVQQNPWVVTSDSGGSATETVMTDGTGAQSGSGYLQLVNTGSAGGDAYLDTPGTYPLASVWTAKVYVRSHTGAAISGSVSLAPTGGSGATQPFSLAAGAGWTPVTVAYTVAGSAPSSLRTDVRVATAGAGLDIDSATIDDSSPAPDGVTSPLPHPQYGYAYLWDEAFGIPGAHLWDLTAQVQFVNGRPGLGVGATLYHDPTKSPNVMSGTDWLWGSMDLNISKADPCFQFKFASTGNSKVSIDGGVFTASDFSMDFAPRGCTIGEDVIPEGASLEFDGGLGSSTIHFDLEISKTEDGPRFYEQLGVNDLVLAGTTYKSMLLTIDVSPTSASESFAGDFILPMGTFDGTFDLSVNESDLHMDGDVTLTDWSLAGGGFDVADFNYHMTMDVPFESGSCASFQAGTNGHMTMAKRSNLAFEGQLEVDCGKLKTLHLDYDYSHGGVTQKFNLDYDSGTNLLSGGTYFSFERHTEWKFFGHKYNRHPKIDLGLEYSMDVSKPASTLDATLSGSISVSGGDGSLTCTINGGTQDDSCHIHVHVNPGGGHTYDSSW